ncbi:uncharacterized protein LOC115241561 [Formica exsecta]|uniref:uncharacterized protein LOC115241561 n=1 Tax=Formica exsecta TaxID=72781 RepID=UPI001143A7F4|nr:uncharacterized protein LOC115241561 [Formica exsecta]
MGCTNSSTRTSLIATFVKRKSTLGAARDTYSRLIEEPRNPRQRRCRVSTMSRYENGTTTDDELTEPERLTSTRGHLSTCDVHNGHDYDDDGYDGRVSRTTPKSCPRIFGMEYTNNITKSTFIYVKYK